MNKFVIVLVCVVLVISGCGGADSRKEKYLQSGNEHYFQDDCNKAKLDYKNALQIDPKSVDGLVGLARCMLEDKEWKKEYHILKMIRPKMPLDILAISLQKMKSIKEKGKSSKLF